MDFFGHIWYGHHWGLVVVVAVISERRSELVRFFFLFFLFFLLRIPIAVGLFIWEGKVSGAGLLHKAIRAFFLLH